MHALWTFVTDFGDTAVTVPLAVVMLGFLAGAREPRVALGWGVAILFCAGLIGSLKLVLFACGDPLAGSGLSSPSGHTAMSTAVYGGFAAVIGANIGRPARSVVFAGAAALIVAIALSRPILGAHSRIEVAVGLAVGSAALALIAAVVARCRPMQLPVGALAMTAIAVALVFHGTRWPAEEGIHHIAGWVEFLLPWCR